MKLNSVGLASKPPHSKKIIITNETKKKQDYTAVTVVTSDLSSGMSNSQPLYQNYNMWK